MRTILYPTYSRFRRGLTRYLFIVSKNFICVPCVGPTSQRTDGSGSMMRASVALLCALALRGSALTPPARRNPGLSEPNSSAQSSSSADPKCVIWGCDCQFLADAFGQNTPKGAIGEWWDAEKCTAKPHASAVFGKVVPIAYNPPDQWAPGQGTPVRRCHCGSAYIVSASCCANRHPGHGCFRIAALQHRVLTERIVGIVHIHARKAGGTSLSTLARSLARLRGWKFHDSEGPRFGPELIAALQRAGWIVVSSFRDPVQRSLSAYDYENRFRGIRAISEDRRNYNNSIPILKWVATVKDVVNKPKDGVWSCCCDCFVGWYGSPMSTSMAHMFRSITGEVAPTELTAAINATEVPRLSHAADTVNQLDYLVEVGEGKTEQMQTSADFFIRAMMGGSTAAAHKVHLTHTLPYLAEYQVLSKSRLPYNVTLADVRALTVLNLRDSSLYRFAALRWATTHCAGVLTVPPGTAS